MSQGVSIRECGRIKRFILNFINLTFTFPAKAFFEKKCRFAPVRLNNDTMDKIGGILNKYALPVLFALFGLFLLIGSGGQTPFFKLGGVAIFVVGVIGTLYVHGSISHKVQLVVGAVVTVGALYFAYLDYAVIDTKIREERKVAKIDRHIIQRLKDIRKAQIAYNRENGSYTNSFDSLLYFLKDGQITLIKRLGTLPDSVPTEEMARELGIIASMPEGWTDEQVVASGLLVRDTIQVDVLGYVFNESDAKTRKTKFFVDSLPYVPFGKHRFELATATIESGGVQQQVFQAIDPKPYKNQYKVGSLTDASTSGNWKE